MSGGFRYDADNAVITIVPIGEEEDYLPELTAEDAEYVRKFSNPERRRSWMAWRAAARTLIGDAEISYAETGAPVILGDGPARFIGVSHSARWAAVIVSSRPCSIDIEDTGRNFGRIAHKYISDEEMALDESPMPLFKAILWCAKETLYKFSGRKGLEYTDDLRVNGINLESGEISAGILSESGAWESYRLRMFPWEECLVVYMNP